jgi:5-oxoprolinase (ATP-hydrolysing)
MWLFSADTGGTFTDCYAVTPDGDVKRCKVLSTGAVRTRIASISEGRLSLTISDSWGLPDHFFRGFSVRSPGTENRQILEWTASDNTIILSEQTPETWKTGQILEISAGEEAPILGARILTRTPLAHALPQIRFRLATTRATNALLEKKGSAVAFFVTRGFGDLMRIGDQRRQSLFALHHEPRPLFHADVHEVIGRMDAEGNVIEKLDTVSLIAAAEKMVACGLRHAAVALLHSQKNPSHEQLVGTLLKEAGFDHVSLSTEIAPFTKILPRAQSAIANAYLTGPVDAFLSRVAERLTSDSTLEIMTSSGGLESRHTIKPKDMLLSGPAGGVIGAANAARDLGFERIITFDMGGTSTDVARMDGRPAYRFSQSVAGMSLLSPCVAIETVAAGGGSICQWKAGGLAVGPESAGADPGPACYGNGGPLTITDVNLLLNRFDVERAPIPFDIQAAEGRCNDLIQTISTSTNQTLTRRDLLENLLQLAIESMATAIRRISVAEGYAPSDHALLAFGGAGPQHACALASHLGMETVLVPHQAGILSAVGLHQALPESFAEKQFLEPINIAQKHLSDWIDSLASQARFSLSERGVQAADCDAPFTLAEIRLRGQDVPLQIPITHKTDLQSAYAEAYVRLFGYSPPANRIIELVSLRVSVRRRELREAQDSSSTSGEKNFITGPALRQDGFSTLIIEPGWQAEERPGFGWILRRQMSPSTAPKIEVRSKSFSSDLYRNRFQGIVEEMGALLCRTSISTNIRERLDFSCALLSADGDLITSAPHIPVHLGALGVCVRETMKHFTPQPGDTFITNHPAFGGSHLPDITLITPVFDRLDVLLGYIANRAHHAEIGGITPGSMPAHAKKLADEGTLINPRYLVKNGQAAWSEIEALFKSGPYPSRNVEDNLADLHAQLAANRLGMERLLSMASDHPDNVPRVMKKILSDSARVMSANLVHMGSGKAEEFLDDGSVIRVQVTTQTDPEPRLIFDFTGTSPPHPGNLNATLAIVQSSVLYVLRLLLKEDVPLNEGLLHPVEIICPTSLLNPTFTGDLESDPAVVGGNVEISQRLVDTLMKALRIQACSQGTMNNLLFGNDHFGYYETLAGGSGAGEGYHGAHALHTHMTNTAITDPEIIEQRYPVRLHEFSIRQNSGGVGIWRGGDGTVREFEFLEPLTLSLLTQHRREGPYGLGGGESGKPGLQTLLTHDGEQTLDSSCSLPVKKGDRLRIETPGGGGFSADYFLAID